MKTNKPARKYRSSIVGELLNEITPVEQMQTGTKMNLAARIDDLITARGWGKSEFADKANKNPSEITKWLSGTQNFTVDTLSEIAVALDMSVAELFAPKQIQVINKIQLVVNVQQVRPAMPYYTPFGSWAVGTAGQFNTGVSRAALSSFISAIPV
jgi:transcriptional regulator with XRE-family HTH domain